MRSQEEGKGLAMKCEKKHPGERTNKSDDSKTSRKKCLRGSHDQLCQWFPIALIRFYLGIKNCIYYLEVICELRNNCFDGVVRKKHDYVSSRDNE